MGDWYWSHWGVSATKRTQSEGKVGPDRNWRFSILRCKKEGADWPEEERRIDKEKTRIVSVVEVIQEKLFKG